MNETMESMSHPVSPSGFTEATVTSPVKFAGGKRKLAGLIHNELAYAISTRIHATDHAFGTKLETEPACEYVEPFLGGASVFFTVWEGWGTRIHYRLADVNIELMNLYTVIRDELALLIAELARTDVYANTEKNFYVVRASEPTTPVTRAARFLWLNKTCFNGLYRVNAKGKFNVPFGKYKNPTIYDRDNLYGIRTALQTHPVVTMDVQPFEATLATCTARSVIYCDPPYVPTSKTANFTGYASGGFREEDQRRLAVELTRLVELGVRVVASNANVPIVRELYPETHFEVREIQAARAVSCKADGRQKVTELLMVGRRG